MILLEHLGTKSLEKRTREAKSPEEIAGLYREVFPLLKQFLTLIPHPAYIKRAFDEVLFTRELRFFQTHFLQTTWGIFFSSSEERCFSEEIAALAAVLAQESRFFVHRDFHSRNVLFHNNTPYTIDFQDARLGAPTYDLISCIFDPYVQISIPLRLQLFEEGCAYLYQQQAHWQSVFLQRMLKILGSYGFLGVTKNPTYLHSIPPTLSFLAAVPVYDVRWPFLSRDLLHRIQETQGRRTHVAHYS
jgi:aminoglycoside/choline kinase family phosphotransferase